MSFDGMVTYAAVKEFRDSLRLGKIDKIYQPNQEQLLLVIHTVSGKRRLLLSSSGNHCAAYLVEKSPENPASPPVFCMVLRKHLNAARIMDIKQYQNDRIIEILMETVNDLGFSVNKKLIIEIMGKHSNILLVDMDSGKIIDSIKHVSIDVNRARQILPGKIYQYPPPQDKIPFTDITLTDMEKLVSDQPQPERSILSGIQGISPALAQTIAASGDPSSCFKKLRDIVDSIDSGNIRPVVYLNESGVPADFHVTPLYGFDELYESVFFDSFSHAADYFFSNREISNTVRQKANDIMRTVKAHLDKLKLKTQRLEEDLMRAENSEKYRLYGELLTANIHMAKTGDTNINVINYYDGSTVSIPLDPRFTPAKNAQLFYKKYGKSKTALKEKKIQLQEVSQTITYLESVVSYLDRASTVEEVDLLKQELIDSGFIRYRKNRRQREIKNKPKPYTYTLRSGKTVMVGRNNRENDWLTLKKASSSDIWFHTKDIPGSHTVLILNGNEPDANDLAEAASIAAFHSKASGSENVPVDYTRIRYVKKPSGAKPGMVIFTHNKTLYVDPAVPDESDSTL